MTKAGRTVVAQRAPNSSAMLLQEATKTSPFTRAFHAYVSGMLREECARPDLNRHARLTEAQDFKSRDSCVHLPNITSKFKIDKHFWAHGGRARCAITLRIAPNIVEKISAVEGEKTWN